MDGFLVNRRLVRTMLAELRVQTWLEGRAILDAALSSECALLDACSKNIGLPTVHEIAMEPVAGRVTLSGSAMLIEEFDGALVGDLTHLERKQICHRPA